MNFITATAQDNVGAWQQVEQPIIKVKSTPQTTDWHRCKYSPCVGGQNCLQMNNKHRHDLRESQKQHEATAAWNMVPWQLMGLLCHWMFCRSCMNNTLVYEVSPEKKEKQETKLITENFIGGIPLWAMVSLNHLIGWDWHLQSRVSQHLCQCWGTTCCLTHASRSTDSGGAVFFLAKENSQSHSAESNTYALTFQLMGNLWRHRGAAQIKINNRDQSAYTFSSANVWRHSCLSTSHKTTRPINQHK